MQWYLAVLAKYATFSGRARRKEYWMFFLGNVIIGFAIGFIEAMLGLGDPVTGLGPLSGLYILAILLPGLAVAVRRLHDTGRSGWYILVAMIPLVNLIFLYWMVKDSDPGPNRYGANPKTSPAFV